VIGNHPLNKEAKQFADDFNEWLEKHEREYHDGERCDEERANMLAYFAHRMGYSHEVLVLMLNRLGDYQAIHEEHHHD
jgi:hypothetical protein